MPSGNLTVTSFANAARCGQLAATHKLKKVFALIVHDEVEEAEAKKHGGSKQGCRLVSEWQQLWVIPLTKEPMWPVAPKMVEVVLPTWLFSVLFFPVDS